MTLQRYDIFINSPLVVFFFVSSNCVLE